MKEEEEEEEEGVRSEPAVEEEEGGKEERDWSGQQHDAGGRRVANFMLADEADSFEEKVNKVGDDKGTAGGWDITCCNGTAANNSDGRIILNEEEVKTGQRSDEEWTGSNDASLLHFGTLDGDWHGNAKAHDGVKGDLDPMSDDVKVEHRLHRARGGGGGAGLGPARDGEHGGGNHSWQVLVAGGVSGVTLVAIMVGLLIWGRCILQRGRLTKKSVKPMGGVDLESVSLDSGDLEVVDNMLATIDRDSGSLQNGKVVFGNSLRETTACRTEETVGRVSDIGNTGDPRKPRKSVHPNEGPIGGQLGAFLSSLSPTSEAQRLSTSGESDRSYHLHVHAICVPYKLREAYLCQNG